MFYEQIDRMVYRSEKLQTHRPKQKAIVKQITKIAKRMWIESILRIQEREIMCIYKECINAP